jgi:hypothetical protein
MEAIRSFAHCRRCALRDHHGLDEADNTVVRTTHRLLKADSSLLVWALRQIYGNDYKMHLTVRREAIHDTLEMD